MSYILEEIQIKIEKFQKFKELLAQAPYDLFEARMLSMSVEGQIRELEKRMDAMTTSKYSHKCTYCDNWIKDENEMTSVKDLTICQRCIATIRKVLNTNEAEERWNLPKGTIKADIHDGVLTEYMNAGLIFKSGRYWQIHESVMQKHYEHRKEEREARKKATVRNREARKAKIYWNTPSKESDD